LEEGLQVMTAHQAAERTGTLPQSDRVVQCIRHTGTFGFAFRELIS
jgi:hypothetical protein